jgi:hypothetical protein
MNQLISLEHSDAYAGCIGNTSSALDQQIHGISGIDAVARNYTLNFNDGGQGLGRHSTLLDGEGIRKQRLKRLAIEALMCIHGTQTGSGTILNCPSDTGPCRILIPFAEIDTTSRIQLSYIQVFPYRT